MQRSDVSWRREPTYRAVLRFGLTLFAVLRIKFRARGTDTLPTEGPMLMAITHFGYLDFALTERVFWQHRRRMMRFMATLGSFRHAISGPLMRGMHHIPVDRSAGQGSVPVALEALQRGEVVGIFPEGGVSTTWRVREIKTGTVRIAAESGVPLVPVGVWGGHRIITKGHGFSVRRAFGTPVHIEFGAPRVIPRDADIRAETLALQQELQTLVDGAMEDYPVPSGERPWWMPVQ